MASAGGCGSTGGNGLPGDGGITFGGDGASGGGSSGGNGSSGGGLAAGVPSTCIVGTQGCLCDSTGGCAPNLTCTPQSPPRPGLGCTGSNCAPSSGSIGATCGSVPNAASCTPGITIPAATGGNDSCGYPTTSFVESTTLCAINAVGGGANPAIVQVFYNDEHALTLGCATTTFPVPPLSSNPRRSTTRDGDPACVDTMGRPLRPAPYVMDLTTDPACTAAIGRTGATVRSGGHLRHVEERDEPVSNVETPP